MASSKVTFEIGDIVWAEWKTVKLKTNIGTVVGLHPPPYYHRGTNASLEKRVLVKLPGYVSERGFEPYTECRHATPDEIKIYFRDKLKYGR